MRITSSLMLFSAVVCAGAGTALALDLDSYRAFIDANREVSTATLLDRHAPSAPYYLGKSTPPGTKVAYLDSVTDSLKLTEGELQLLARHDFLVTERLSYNSFGAAMHKVYSWDLPAFVTSDAILHAMHMSYDKILIDIEKSMLIPALDTVLTGLSRSLGAAIAQLHDTTGLLQSIVDVDLYISVARTLLKDTLSVPHVASPESLATILNAIESEQMTTMPLFTTTPRRLDFSQFTVRGHYADVPLYGSPAGMRLATYFKAMMWLGRMDFLLTAPPDLPGSRLGPQETRRMTIDAAFLSYLIDKAGVRAQLTRIDEFLTFLVGESDNLTPDEFARAMSRNSISSPRQLLVDSTYTKLQDALQRDTGATQRILSDIFIANPYSDKPDTLPISYRLMGQRFIVDSYIFSNVVYDRIVFNGTKVWRPMPDVLDAMFALGNNDALPLVQSQLDQYHYGPQLTAMRYLVDSHGTGFWTGSLYNCWLSAIRALNPQAHSTGQPLFMKTTAWHQQKLNTQCASWAQLRHDNLLYTKQSYTWGTACSFPHSYVEPYPELYSRIGSYAATALSRFSAAGLSSYSIINYYDRLSKTMKTLQAIAEKQLAGQATSTEEREFLKKMLFQEGGSGAPPFSGWYADLFYRRDDAAQTDHIVADVHTQPTDQAGAMVGQVLHAGVGDVNLGVFVAPSPSSQNHLMAFVGPVFSYHEKITDNFKRLTDQEWAMIVRDSTPSRPDWVNLYLASDKGVSLPKGRALPGIEYSSKSNRPFVAGTLLYSFTFMGNSAAGSVVYRLPEAGPLRVSIIDCAGQTVFSRSVRGGTGSLQVPSGTVSSGAYVLTVHSRKGTLSKQFVVAR